MHPARTRFLFCLAFIVCATSVGAAVYLQFAYNLMPCLLCQVQRALLLACALICLVAAVHAPTALRSWHRYALALLVTAMPGAGVAGAHIGSQTSTAEQLGLAVAHVKDGFSLLALPAWGDALKHELLSCAEINWSLFGISLPEWSLLAFVGIILLALYLLLVEIPRKILPADQTLV
ncbi:disulfide bond formation protein B [Pseudomonas syringae]|nr:disulfide bond formation protein B [Pseudomonas syringae]MBD8577045.1 disulfide bond formation protein B [Pseudomonas syringae]MBD8788338.1 disulfide bond formation protein B [Pseudomonas syringae]MBD8799462.1 disulfide bond formation protein B [Pseudomonas syringae]MBD8814670.1 disulfide bond formation protein B [Pseudomonas syringae]